MKVKEGTRSALAPIDGCGIATVVDVERPGRSFASEGIRAISPERSHWEDLLILHGAHCGYRDGGC